MCQNSLKKVTEKCSDTLSILKQMLRILQTALMTLHLFKHNSETLRNFQVEWQKWPVYVWSTTYPSGNQGPRHLDPFHQRSSFCRKRSNIWNRIDNANILYQMQTIEPKSISPWVLWKSCKILVSTENQNGYQIKMKLYRSKEQVANIH